MTVTYTNRKGTTYTLCRGTTKKGKPRYYFAREPKGEPVEQMPEGYEIRESVNGLVSLAKIRPQLIRPDETAWVQAAIGRHRKGHNYRLDVKGDRIEIYERTGTDPDELIPMLKQRGGPLAQRAEGVRDILDEHARFSRVMRFILVDKDKRTFRAQRWCYSSSIDNWIDVGSMRPLRQLARTLIPKLGTPAFFDLY